MAAQQLLQGLTERITMTADSGNLFSWEGAERLRRSVRS
jgi:hypothetical protein